MKWKLQLITLAISTTIVHPQGIPAEISACEAASHIEDIAFSPDNQLVLASWSPGEARLWDINTGKVRKIWSQGGDQVTSVGFSPDGKSAFTASGTSIIIWDVATGDKQQVLNLSEGNTLIQAAYVANGQQLITAGGYNGAKLWDVSTGRLIYVFPGNIDRDIGERLQISPNGTYMLFNDDEPGKGQNLWNIMTREKVYTFQSPSEEAFTPDSKSLIVSHLDDALKWELFMFDIATKESVKTFPISSGLGDVVFSPDGKYFLAGHDVYEVELWDTPKASQLHVFHVVPHLSYTFYPDSKRLLILYTYEPTWEPVSFIIWDIPSNRMVKQWSMPISFGDIEGILSNNGNYLWVVADNTIRLLDGHSGELIRYFC